MSADLQFKQLIDRILRCREAEDEAKEDTKAVYAELKGLGYDKTAAGALVAELRKLEKDPDKFRERGTVLDLYRDAYDRASGTVVATHTHEAAPVDRKARAAVRTSEEMDDNKAFSAKLLANGLISEEAHAENIAISDGVARKYGAGVIDPETGKIPPSEPASPLPVSEQAGDAAPKPSPATPIPSQARGWLAPGPSAFIPEEEVPAFLKKDRASVVLRPHCQNPSVCASGTRDHCYSCKKAMAESEAA